MQASRNNRLDNRNLLCGTSERILPKITGAIVLLVLGSVSALSHTTFTSDGTPADVQRLHDSPNCVDGDTIIIPAGTYSWSTGIVLTKAVTLRGASMWSGGSGAPLVGGSQIQDNLTTAGNLITLHTGTGAHVTLSQLALIPKNAASYNNQHVYIEDGPTGSLVPLVHDCYFETGTDGTNRSIDWRASGGVCWNCHFWSHQQDNSGIRIEGGSLPWQSRSTYGVLDANGVHNVYIEDCVFTDIYLQALDFDQWARVVVRHNTFSNSAVVTHGDTDQGIDGSGGRQTELYDNTFTFTLGANGGASQDKNGYPLNLNYWWYCRGGTFVSFNNVLPDIQSQWWGTKASYILIIQKLRRSAGTYGCWDRGYPAPFQPGWGSDGTTVQGNSGLKMVLDPIYVWSNRGGSNSNTCSVQDYSTDECGHNLSDSNYIVANREYYQNITRPNYTPYTYPHPLRNGDSPTPTPTPTPSSTVSPTPTPKASATPTPKASATPTPSPSATPKPTPTPTPKPTPTATPSPTPKQTASPTQAPIPVTPKFIQGAYSVPQTPQKVVTVTYKTTQAAGNLNVVVVGWNDTTAQIASVTDSNDSIYQLAAVPQHLNGAVSQAIYYAKNISGGANAVTVTFNVAAVYPDIRVLEYSGVDPVNPLDTSIGNTGNGWTSSTGFLTTTNSADLLVSANTVQTLTVGPSSNFSERLLTNPDGDIAQDQIVSSTGSHGSSTALTNPGGWVMQMVAFRTVK